MKRRVLFLFVACAAALTAFTSCKENNPEDPSRLKAVYDGSVFAYQGGTATLDIESNVAWTIVNLDSRAWVTIERMNGTGDAELTVTVQPTSESGRREGRFRVETDVVGVSPYEFIVSQDGLTIPGTAGPIRGANENVYPATTVTLEIDAVEGATNYQWYKDEVAIENASLLAYTVTESGSYQVAAVNAAGEGPKSPAHQVTINVFYSVADLLGTWNVSEVDIFTLDLTTGEPLENPIETPVNYTVTMTQALGLEGEPIENTVTISNFAEADYAILKAYGLQSIQSLTVAAELDPVNGTLTIPDQQTPDIWIPGVSLIVGDSNHPEGRGPLVPADITDDNGELSVELANGTNGYSYSIWLGTGETGMHKKDTVMTKVAQ